MYEANEGNLLFNKINLHWRHHKSQLLGLFEGTLKWKKSIYGTADCKLTPSLAKYQMPFKKKGKHQ
jgi:hypothetical protein